MAKSVITKTKVRIFVGVALSSALITAFIIAVVINQGYQKTGSTGVETELGLNLNDLSIFNEILDSVVTVPGFNETMTIPKEKFILDPHNDNAIYAWAQLNDTTLTTVFDEDSLSFSFPNSDSTSLTLNLDMPKTSISGKLHIYAWHDAYPEFKILETDPDPDFSITGLAGTAKVGLGLNDNQEPTVSSFSITDVTIDDIYLDWDDLGGWQKLKLSLGLKANCGLGVFDFSAETIEKIEPCLIEDIEDNLKKNTKLERKLKTAVNDAIQDPFYISADTSASNLFAITTAQLTKLERNKDQDNVQSELEVILDPSYTLSDCGEQVSVSSASATLGKPNSDIIGEIDLTVPYDFVETMFAHVARAGWFCLDPISIKDGQLDVDVDLQLSGTATVAKGSYDMFVVTKNPSQLELTILSESALSSTASSFKPISDTSKHAGSNQYKQWTASWEELDGLEITMNFVGQMTGTVSGQSVNEDISGSIAVIGDLTTDNESTLGFTIRNVVVQDLTLPFTLQRTKGGQGSSPAFTGINEEDLVDKINQELQSSYYFRAIYDFGVGYCANTLQHYVTESIYYVDCPDCTYSFGLVVGDLAQYGIRLNDKLDKNLLDSAVVIGLSSYDDEYDEDISTDYDTTECNENPTILSDLPNSTIEQMIEAGLIHGKIMNMVDWITSKTVAQIEDEINVLQNEIDQFLKTQATDQAVDIPIQFYPWYNYTAVR